MRSEGNDIIVFRTTDAKRRSCRINERSPNRLKLRSAINSMHLSPCCMYSTLFSRMSLHTKPTDLRLSLLWMQWFCRKATFLATRAFLWPRTQISVPKPSLCSIWGVTALTGARSSKPSVSRQSNSLRAMPPISKVDGTSWRRKKKLFRHQWSNLEMII